MATKSMQQPDAPAPPIIEPELSRPEIARMLGVSPDTITLWCEEAGMPHFRRTKGGHLRFLASKVIEWRERTSAVKAPAPGGEGEGGPAGRGGRAPAPDYDFAAELRATRLRRHD